MYQNNPSNYFMSRSNSNLCVHLCTSLHADRKQGSFILLIIHCNIKTAVTKIVLNLKNKKTGLPEYATITRFIFCILSLIIIQFQLCIYYSSIQALQRFDFP